MMRHHEGTFRGGDGSHLYYQVWSPPCDVRGVLVGIDDDSSVWGERLAEGLVALGFSCYAFDQRGHGRSPGIRGHVPRWAEYREDLRALLDLVGLLEPGLPVVLLGHGLGGLLALDSALSCPERVAGVVGIRAPLAVASALPAWRRWALGAAGRVLPAIRPEAEVLEAQARVLAGSARCQVPRLLLDAPEHQELLAWLDRQLPALDEQVASD